MRNKSLQSCVIQRAGRGISFIGPGSVTATLEISDEERGSPVAWRVDHASLHSGGEL